MKSIVTVVLGLLPVCLLGACGQDDLRIPDQPQGGVCGDYYPGGGAFGDDDVYGIEEGKTFPCIAFESVRLAGEDTFIHFADEYLRARHGDSDLESIIIITSADHCPGCAVLMEEILDIGDAFDDAGTLFVGAAWCDNLDPSNCDFTLDEAELVLESEGWPVDRWPVTNDAEGHLRPGFGDAFPSAIVIRLANMRVRRVDTAPEAGALLELVQRF
jgi:hypothetical protein